MSVVTEELFPLADAGEPVVEIPSGLSADRRRTLRRLVLIDRGEHPITHLPLHEQAPSPVSAKDRYPRPFTCGTCVHRFVMDWHNKSYPKCDLLGSDGHQAHSAVTDTYRWLPACTAYRPVG